MKIAKCECGISANLEDAKKDGWQLAEIFDENIKGHWGICEKCLAGKFTVKDIKEFVAIYSKPELADKYTMGFGKHINKVVSTVPKSYFNWAFQKVAIEIVPKILMQCEHKPKHIQYIEKKAGEDTVTHVRWICEEGCRTVTKEFGTLPLPGSLEIMEKAEDNLNPTETQEKTLKCQYCNSPVDIDSLRLNQCGNCKLVLVQPTITDLGGA